jgi:hypothetical protein
MAIQESTIWITEEEAAHIMELPAPFFRNLVLDGSLKGVVHYTGSNNDSYKYVKEDIENYIFEDSFFASL